MAYPGFSMDEAFIEQYKDTVIQLAQQTFAKLRGYVTEESGDGKAFNHERLASTEAIEKLASPEETPSPGPPDWTEKRVETNLVDDVWDRRVTMPRTFTHAFTVEHEDKVQMLVSPENALTLNQAMAMARQYDRLITEAATGDATDGDGGAVSFPAGQVVGDGTTPISFDMMTEVQELFLSNEIDMDIPKVCVIGPTQVRKLLQLTEQTSADYVKTQALQTLSAYGIVPNWMGFTWVMSNMLQIPAAGELSCLAFTPRALTLVVNADVWTRIAERPDLSHLIQIFSQFTAGCSRTIDEEIVHIHVLNSL